MIAANELRIGNWVMSDDVNMPYQVTAAGILVIANSPENRSPIPLTPEILIACGFNGNVLLLGEKGVCSLGWHFISNTYKKETTVNLAYDYDDCAYESHNSEHETEIKYLHQLENLYFVLTGKEIKINL